MSRRAINERRAADNPEWRNPAEPGIRIVHRAPDDIHGDRIQGLLDEVANLRNEVSRLAAENAALRAGAPPRAPTQSEILGAIARACQVKGETQTARVALAEPLTGEPLRIVDATPKRRGRPPGSKNKAPTKKAAPKKAAPKKAVAKKGRR